MTTLRPLLAGWGHGFMNKLKTEQSFDSQATRVIGVHGPLLTYYPWVFYHQALADVRSTAAGTECPHFISNSGQ